MALILAGSARRLAAAVTVAAAVWQGAHLSVDGTAFRKGKDRFEWRGITAFRLVEQIAHGRERDAIAYLDWAAGQRLTVVRVLVMARHLFALDPEKGRAALPRLLQLAADRGLYVEIVPLADTNDLAVDHQAHVKSVGAIAAKHWNALVEIANEPWHPTQDKRLHDPAYVERLAQLIPGPVPVALGSVEGADGYAAGDYVTWHSPRSDRDNGWGHVLALAEGAGLLDKWKKPLVGDEPIGAADKSIPGRRDSEPARFAAAAALSRLAGLGATFHYEGGLQARVPAGRELACFTAWQAGLDLLRDLPEGGRFVTASALEAVANVKGARAVFGREYQKAVWIVVVDPGPGVSVTAAKGWRLQPPRRYRGVEVHQARR